MATVEELYAQLQSNISGGEAVNSASPEAVTPEVDALYSQLKSNITEGPKEKTVEPEVNLFEQKPVQPVQQPVQQIEQSQQSIAQPVAEPQPKGAPSFFDKLGNVFSGNLDRTPEMEGMGHLGQVGAISKIMGEASMADKMKFSTLNLLTFNPNEVAKIATAMNPDISVIYNKDNNGNVFPILTNQSTGDTLMVNDPSLDMGDLGKFAGAGAAFTPAGAAATVTKGLGKKALVAGATSAATQTAIEGAQVLGGGDVDASEVALAAGGGVLGEFASPVIKKAFQGSKATLAKARDLIKRAGGGEIAEAVAEPIARTADEIKQIRVSEAAKGFETDELGNLVGGDGGRQAQINQALQAGDENRLAKMIDADPQFFKDKETLGLIQEGVPTQASTSKQIQQTGESFSKIQGSDLYEKVKLQQEEIGEKAHDLVQKYGATDKGSADFDLFEKTDEVIKELTKVEGDAYSGITKAINSDYIEGTNAIKTTLKSEGFDAVKTDGIGDIGASAVKFAKEGGSNKELKTLIGKVDDKMTAQANQLAKGRAMNAQQLKAQQAASRQLINTGSEAKAVTPVFDEAAHIDKMDITNSIKNQLDDYNVLEEGQLVSLDASKKAILERIRTSAKGTGVLNSLEKKILGFDTNGASYGDVDGLRKQIGEALSGKKDVFPTVGEGSLKKLYALLSADQEKAATKFGMSEQWGAAKELSRNKYDLQDKAKTLFGNKLEDKGITKRVATSLQGLSTGDSKSFSKLINSLPSGTPEADAQRLQIVTTALKDIFKGGSNKAEGFSVGQFADWYTKLNTSPAYKNMLYKELPKDMRTQLDALGRFTSKIKQAYSTGTSTGLNLTSDAAINKIKKGAQGFISRAINNATLGAVNVGEALTQTEAKKIAIDKAAGVLNSPQFINMVKAASHGKEEVVEAMEKKLMQTTAIRELKKTMSEAKKKALMSQGFVRWMDSEFGEEE